MESTKLIRILIVFFILTLNSKNADAFTFTVTNTNDSGAGSLRDVVLGAANGDQVIFDAGIANQTITLLSEILTVCEIIIDGTDKNITISGGGSVRCLHSNGNSLTINNLTIANGNSNEAGGIYLEGSGILTLYNVILRNCTSTGNGGAVETFSVANHSFTNVKFIGNSGGWGGGYYKLFGSVTMDNCLFSGNQANSGGAMYLRGGSDVLTNCTVTGNHGTTYAGAIYFYNGNVDLRNCIFWNNQAASNLGTIETFFEINTGSATIDAWNCIIQGSGGSALWNAAFGNDLGGNLDVDPEFNMPITASTAPTTNGNFEVVLASPAIDAGANGFVSTPIDLIQHTRVIYGIVDMGCYEFCETVGTEAPVVCASYTGPSGLYTWTTSGIYTDTLSNYLGCDSVITIALTVQQSYNTISPVVCDSYTSPSGMYNWTSSGAYQDTITNYLGCDSILTINLTINNETTSSIAPTVCNTYTSPSGSYIWTSSGIYMDTIPNTIGCDSVITISLTVNNETTSSISPVVCDSYLSPSGLTWTSSGVYSDTIPNSLGCDSVITVNLTVNYETTSNISPVVCGTYTSPSGLILTSSSVFNDTITNSNGCDSIININLTVNNETVSTINPVACNSYTSPSGNYIWSASGSYQDTIPNTLGCDSVITINLTINNQTTSTISPTACNSYLSPSGQNFTSSGIYTDTISNYLGCDSIITIDLTLNNQTTSSLSPTECTSYTSPSGLIFTSSGLYSDTIPNSVGCDSIISIDLLIITPTVSTISDSACYTYTSPSGLYIWTASGTYNDTIPNTLGCDSIITINLTINSSFSTLNPTVCYSYTSPSGLVWTMSGIYSDTIPNYLGCDSIISIDLIVNIPDVSTTIISTTIGANAASATYQWLDCNDSLSIISGETNQSYMPDFDGSYAVEVIEFGCIDTSACVDIIIPIAPPSTAFSPNGDGVNDTFVLKIQDSDNTVIFYNRWGDQIRIINGYDDVLNAWDGKDENGNLVSGTIYYTVRSERNYSGWVQVLH